MTANKFSTFIVCGVDRLGKDTLIDNIQQKLGHHFVLHYSKPQALEAYDNDAKKYQEESFYRGFSLIENCRWGLSRTNLIFNRFHLGECVYAPLYRGYTGTYVFDLEEEFDVETWDRVKLILLTTSDFSIVQDDGESFDFSKKEQEQELFKQAFYRSAFPCKTMIDVADGKGGFKDPLEILKLAIS